MLEMLSRRQVKVEGVNIGWNDSIFRRFYAFIPKKIKNLLMLRKVKVSAPGKIALSGEHAVVYGYPEILVAVDRRIFIEFEEKKEGLKVIPKEGRFSVESALEQISKKFGRRDLSNISVRITSQLPIGCGMGSSAAFAVALTAGFFEFLKLPWRLEKINEIAYELEKRQSINPSGGDNTVSTYGGFLLYRRETESFKVFSSLKTEIFPSFFLTNSGERVETTKEMIEKVRKFRSRFPVKTENIFRKMEQVSRNFLKFLSGEELNIGSLIRANERLLEDLGVVSPKAINLIRRIEAVGGSAKISGAGGTRSGSGIVLIYHAEPKTLLSFAKKENLDIFEVKLSAEGVRNESNC